MTELNPKTTQNRIIFERLTPKSTSKVNENQRAKLVRWICHQRLGLLTALIVTASISIGINTISFAPRALAASCGYWERGGWAYYTNCNYARHYVRVYCNGCGYSGYYYQTICYGTTRLGPTSEYYNARWISFSDRACGHRESQFGR